jgi:hypothetical protein
LAALQQAVVARNLAVTGDVVGRIQCANNDHRAANTVVERGARDEAACGIEISGVPRSDHQQGAI